MDAEIKVLSAENSDLTKVPSFKTGASQNVSIALCAVSTVKNSAFLCSVFPVHSISFAPPPLQPIFFKRKVTCGKKLESEF